MARHGFRIPLIRPSSLCPLVERTRATAFSSSGPALPGGGNTRCVWLSTKPGITTLPAALISMASRASARFSTGAWAHLHQHAVPNQHPPIGYNPQFAKFGSPQRAFGAAQCEQLACPPD